MKTNKHQDLSENRASSLPVRYLLGAQRSTWSDPWSPGTFMWHFIMELRGAERKVAAFQPPAWEGNSECDREDQRKTLSHD